MLHAYSIRNGRIADAMPETGQGQLWIYEVLRLVKGVPLFAEAHWERMQRSAQLSGYAWPLPLEDMTRGIRELAIANGVYEGNIKMLFGWSGAAGAGEWAACFIPHRYPTARDYIDGVTLAAMPAERDNPNAKTLNASLRERADALIRQSGAYEVLLTDHHGHITEGSRSNCFFVRLYRVFTPPVEQVLPGVTRAQVLQICKYLSLPLAETPVHTGDLAGMEAAFITGTSPGVLPVARIDNIEFDPKHPLVKAIHAAYERRVRDYITAAGPP